MLPVAHRQRLWSPMAELITDEGYRTLRPGSSQFTLRPEQVKEWPNFAKEVKDLLAPYCGQPLPFMPIVLRETFAVANELGVQGRLVNNALHPVGEAANIMGLGVRFGDSQYGVSRLLVEAKKAEKKEIKKEDKRKRADQPAGGKLVPDLVVVDINTHAIRALGEVKTFWRFEPRKNQSWDEFLADKMDEFSLSSLWFLSID